jgi:putative FmdB family regulatory protein
MPNYRFRCGSCFEEIEARLPMSQSDVVPTCGCGADMKKVLGAPFVFPYGQEQFHGPTIKERQEEQMRLAPNAVPASEYK